MFRGSIGFCALVTFVCTLGTAQAFDESKYPDLKGQWNRTTAPRWEDASKAPLTPEYRAIFEANVKDQAEGGQGETPTYTCVSPGMPRVMNAYEPFEIVVTPQSTHFLMDHIHDSRRILTDGREFPEDPDPTYAGYSIGKWVDEDGDGKYDVLVVETRALRGPRSYDSTGTPFHRDNKTVIKERIYLDKTNKDTLYDEITVFDNALTRPWTNTKKYVRSPNRNPVWGESVCAEGNQHVVIEDQGYMLSSDGYLMPSKKGQRPPDLTYFNTQKK
jgi:hypothetical protein